MKNKILLIGGLAVFALMGAGCNFTSLEDTADVEESDSISEVQKENDKLKEDLKDLEKKVSKLQKDSEEKDEDKKDEDKSSDEKNEETEEDLDQPWYADLTESEIKEIQQENKEKDYPKNERGRQIIADPAVTTDLGDKRIDILLVTSEEPNPAQSESPALRFGCGDYLYPTSINLDEDKSQSDLATAIVELLTHKPDADSGMENIVRGKGFVLENVKYEDGTRIIELSGADITSAGACESERIKAQMEETIAMYADKFEIRLNGSASEWQCLFDESGTCS